MIALIGRVIAVLWMVLAGYRSATVEKRIGRYPTFGQQLREIALVIRDLLFAAVTVLVTQG